MIDLRISPEHRIQEIGKREPIDVTARLVVSPGYRAWPDAGEPTRCRLSLAPHPLVSHNMRGLRFGHFVVQGEFRSKKQSKSARYHARTGTAGPPADLSLRCDCGRYEVRPKSYLLTADESHLCCLKCRPAALSRARYDDVTRRETDQARRYQKVLAARIKRSGAVPCGPPEYPVTHTTVVQIQIEVRK